MLESSSLKTLREGLNVHNECMGQGGSVEIGQRAKSARERERERDQKVMLHESIVILCMQQRGMSTTRN